jgi:hypothetical protein
MTLRVGAHGSTRDIRFANDEGSKTNAYFERLVKLVPMEVIGAYPLLIQGAASAGAYAPAITSWILLALVILVRAKATATLGQGPQWPAVAIAAVSFVIWVHVVGGDFGLRLLLDQLGVAIEGRETAIAFYRNLALVVWTIVVPLFYKGDETQY